MTPERVTAIAESVRTAGGRALIVGGWVRDRLLGCAVHERRPRSVRRAGGPTPDAARIVRTRRGGRRELSGLQGRRHRRVAAAARFEVRTRPSRVRGHRRSVDVDRGGGAAARLHDQRDFVGSADRRVPRSVSRPRRSRPAGSCASSIRPRFPTTACASCAPFSSRRGFR